MTLADSLELFQMKANGQKCASCIDESQKQATPGKVLLPL